MFWDHYQWRIQSSVPTRGLWSPLLKLFLRKSFGVLHLNFFLISISANCSVSFLSSISLCISSTNNFPSSFGDQVWSLEERRPPSNTSPWLFETHQNQSHLFSPLRESIQFGLKLLLCRLTSLDCLISTNCEFIYRSYRQKKRRRWYLKVKMKMRCFANKYKKTCKIHNIKDIFATYVVFVLFSGHPKFHVWHHKQLCMANILLSIAVKHSIAMSNDHWVSHVAAFTPGQKEGKTLHNLLSLNLCCTPQ